MGYNHWWFPFPRRQPAHLTFVPSGALTFVPSGAKVESSERDLTDLPKDQETGFIPQDILDIPDGFGA